MKKVSLQTTDDEKNMRAALAEAQKAFALGEVPVGAVFIDDAGKIITAAHNLCETRNDAAAHAEMLALNDAAAILKRRYFTDCTLYVTLEPCPMCAGACLMRRVGRIVYGAVDVRAGACESLFNVTNNPALFFRAKITAGVLEDECAALLKKFFAERRAKQKECPCHKNAP